MYKRTKQAGPFTATGYGAGLGLLAGGGSGFAAGKYIDPTGNLIATTGALGGSVVGGVAGVGAGISIDAIRALARLVANRQKPKRKKEAGFVQDAVAKAKPWLELVKADPGMQLQGTALARTRRLLELARSMPAKVYLDSMLRAWINKWYRELGRQAYKPFIGAAAANERMAGRYLLRGRQWSEKDFNPDTLQAMRNIVLASRTFVPDIDANWQGTSTSLLPEELAKRKFVDYSAYKRLRALFSDVADDDPESIGWDSMKMSLLDPYRHIQRTLGQFNVDERNGSTYARDVYDFAKSYYRPDKKSLYNSLRWLGSISIPDEGLPKDEYSTVSINLGRFDPATWAKKPTSP